MEKKYLKKVLAGFSIAGLMTGVGLIVPGPAAAGWSGSKDAGSVLETKKPTPPPSGWSGTKAGAVSTEEKKEGAASGSESEEKEEKKEDVGDNKK